MEERGMDQTPQTQTPSRPEKTGDLSQDKAAKRRNLCTAALLLLIVLASLAGVVSHRHGALN
jgi:hypothetical protein